MVRHKAFAFRKARSIGRCVMAQLVHQELEPSLGNNIRPFLVERLVVPCLGDVPDPLQSIGIAAIGMHQPPILSGLGIHLFKRECLSVVLDIAQGNIEIRNELKIHSASSKKKCESGCNKAPPERQINKIGTAYDSLKSQKFIYTVKCLLLYISCIHLKM